MRVETLGYLAAALTTASFVPQALQTFRTRNTEGISLVMYAMLVAGVALWAGYGIAIGSVPVIVANVVTLLLSASILVMTVRARLAVGPAAPS